jgi:hypothetical protein
MLCHFGLLITFCGLANVAIFTTNVDAKYECLINHKIVCGAMSRQFCQTAVVRSCCSIQEDASYKELTETTSNQ